MGGSKLPTAEIIRELRQARNREGYWTNLYDTYHGMVRRYLEKKGLSKIDSEDLTQEVFFRVYRNLESIHAEERFDAWLFRIAKNLYLNRVRDTRVHWPEPGLVSEEGHSAAGNARHVASSEASPEEAVLEKEKWDTVYRALQELPAKMRRCVLLHIEGVPKREIADIMGISVNTVKAHLGQAKPILREKLKPYFKEVIERLDWENRNG